MQRVSAIDGLRGLCLVLMMLTHLELERPMLLATLHVKQLGFADSAQGFIFLAGFVIGMVGLRKIQRDGAAALQTWSRRRALRLYTVHAGLLLCLVVLVQLIPDAVDAWAGWMGPLAEPSSGYNLAAALLLFQPSYMDILPQYVLYILMAPAILIAVAAGRTGLVAGLSIGTWLLTQLGLHLPLLAALETGLAGLGMEIGVRAFFNPLGWQLVFVAGVLLGAHSRDGKLAEKLQLDPGKTGLVSASLVILAVAAVWRLAFSFGLLSDELVQRLGQQEHRAELGFLTVLDFAAIGYCTAWLLVAGPRTGSALIRGMAAVLDRVVSHPWLAMIGRHSLPVFTYHVLLIYLLMAFDFGIGRMAEPMHSLVGIAAILSLSIPALLSEHLPRLLGQAQPAVPSPARSQGGTPLNASARKSTATRTLALR